MLICKRANITFIQIPKNGSKSIRAALLAAFGLDHAPVAKDLGWTVEQFDAAYATGSQDYLAALGKNNLDHLTLAVYREHLPEAFAAFCAAQSFALIREPRERFVSALLQRLGQFRKIKNIRVDDPAVAEEARHVCAWLDGRGVFNDKEYIHFARQIDYVDLDGQRLVSAIFPINRTDVAEQWIEAQTGTKVGIAHEHARREPKALGKVLYPPLRFVGRRLFSRNIRKLIYPIWSSSKLFEDAAKRYDTIDLGPEVEQFIAQYYADDARLYREACTGVGALPALSEA